MISDFSKGDKKIKMKVIERAGDYLAEEELLLAEIPPTSKMFKPPKEDILDI